jgi:peptidyl-prolyl cis-trans isomerase B (cyclophilin B)
MAYSGSDPRMAESQIYILRRNDPTLDARYAVFGAVIKGMEVVDKIEKGDMLKRASVKE